MNEVVELVAITVAPWLAVLIAAITGRSKVSGGSVSRVAASIVALGFLAALAAVPSVIAQPGIRVGFAVTTLQLDALALILSMIVLGLSALIQAFAVRYLRGDIRQVWFVVCANLLTGFTVLMVCAGSVAVFALGWIGTGVALVLLLGTYWPLAQARDGVRRTGYRFALADAAFLVAAGALVVAAGADIPLDRLSAVAALLPLPAQVTLAVLLVVSALARSSQIPFHGWLPFTLAAPTPVSALMHAGVVNGGAILLIRFAPVIATHRSVMITVFLAGAATVVYASAARLVRPDVKGRLVFSTMAQMGYMIMACGLGVFGAAIFHLVAHSLFKSSLFLGAGMVVRRHTVDRDLPARHRLSAMARVAAVVLSITVPAASLVAATIVLAPTLTAPSVGLLIFVDLTASVALATALLVHFSVRTVAAGVTTTAALAFAYVAFLHIFTAALEPGSGITSAPAWLLILPTLGLLILQILSRNPRRFARLRDFFYVRSLIAVPARPAPNKGVFS
jgi:NAD(P)H-quinone oxidoreductase subunit 5